MNPLWLVDRGPHLKALSLRKPSGGAIARAGLEDCTVRRSPVAPHQLLIGGGAIEADTFRLVGEQAERESEETAAWKRRQEMHENLKGLKL